MTNRETVLLSALGILLVVCVLTGHPIWAGVIAVTLVVATLDEI